MKLQIEVDLKKDHDPFEEIKWILKDLALSDKTASIGKFNVYDSNGKTVGLALRRFLWSRWTEAISLSVRRRVTIGGIGRSSLCSTGWPHLLQTTSSFPLILR